MRPQLNVIKQNDNKMLFFFQNMSTVLLNSLRAKTGNVYLGHGNVMVK